MGLVDAYLEEMKGKYPELIFSETIDEDRMSAMWQEGVGITCGRVDPEKHIIVPLHELTTVDPICPEQELWPSGVKIAKSLDFDGDGRADLVNWTNGSWKIDLSSVGNGGDNFGAYDLILTHPKIPGTWVWQYVSDMNSDGRTDLVVYDKEHGTWYVTFTDYDLLSNGQWPGWDWVIDYSAEWTDDLRMDPWQSHYSRPVPGDYNGDGWA